MNCSAVNTLIFIFLLSISTVNGQQCYDVIEDALGFHEDSGIAMVNIAACEFVNSLDIDVRDSFNISYISFYSLSDNFQGGEETVWDDIISSYEENDLYYVAFGEEYDRGVSDTKPRIAMKLPTYGYFGCLDDRSKESLLFELNIILSNYNKDFYLREIEAIVKIGDFLQQLNICCDAQSRNSINIDPELIGLSVCFNNCENPSEPINAVALISDNIMPSIKFRIDYPLIESAFCLQPLVVDIIIEYQKNTDVSSRDRNDVILFRQTEIKLNQWNEIEWGERDAYGVTWEVVQGGRVDFKIKQSNESLPIKSFDNYMTIKGVNPSIRDVMEYIDDSYPTIWFMKKLALVESGTFSTINTSPVMHFEPLNGEDEDLHIDWEDNSRCPRTNKPSNPNNFGDGGFGMMQLTDPVPLSQALWDWKCNLAGAYSVLYLKRQSIKNSFLNLYNPILKDWVEENPTDKPLVSVSYGGYTWKMGASEIYGSDIDLYFEDGVLDEYFNETLGEGEKSLLDAWLIQKYNCQSCNFLIFGESEESGKPTFIVNFVNTIGGNDHVLSVLEKVVPGVNLDD